MARRRHNYEPLKDCERDALTYAYLQKNDTLRIMREALYRPGTEAYREMREKREGQK